MSLNRRSIERQCLADNDGFGFGLTMVMVSVSVDWLVRAVREKKSGQHMFVAVFYSFFGKLSGFRANFFRRLGLRVGLQLVLNYVSWFEHLLVNYLTVQTINSTTWSQFKHIVCKKTRDSMNLMFASRKVFTFH